MLKEGWFEALEPVDFVRSGAIVCLLVAGGFGSSRSWINTRVVMGFAMLAAACFPEVLLEFQISGPVSPLTRVFLQLGAVSAVLFSVFMVMNKDTRDDRFWLTVFLAGAVGHALMSVIGIQGQRMLYNTKPGLTTQHLFFSVLFMVVMTVGDLRHSLIFRGSSRTVAGAGRHHLNIHILINLFIIIVAATRNLAVPDEQVKYFLAEGAAIDPINVHQMRNFGAMGISGSIMCILALGFADSTKRSLLLFFAVSSVLHTAVFVLHFLAGNITSQGLGGATVFNGVLVANNLIGYVLHRK